LLKLIAPVESVIEPSASVSVPIVVPDGREAELTTVKLDIEPVAAVKVPANQPSAHLNDVEPKSREFVVFGSWSS
jgi:hypothetical protein